MTHRISEIPNLEGRIKFRRNWITRHAPAKPKVHPKSIGWEIAYDEEHNFARMGVEFVDDDWGKPPIRKPKARRKSDFLRGSFIRATARTLDAAE